MSEPLSNNSHDKDNNSGEGNDPLEYMFDPSSSGTPSLRPPKLSEAGLQAAIQFGFSETYLPSSVTGGDRNSSVSERGNNRQPAAPMSNNHSNSNNYNHHHHAMSGSQNQSPLFVDNYNVGLTPQELEGLLAPLQRPDLSQLPPDVLAALLKSSRFEEIVIPTQGRLAENANAQQQQRNLQEGVNSVGGGAASGSFTNSNNSAHRGRAATQRSADVKYNPSAPEFVPTSFQPSSMNQQQQEAADLAYVMSQVQFQDQHDSFQNFDEFEGPDCILSTITDMISQVSKDPPSLGRCTKISTAVLKKHLIDEDTLGIVVTLLTEQMISNENFCYSGAKILETFRQSEIGINGKSIKALLLHRMKEEFDHCLKNLAEADVRVRSLGVVHLLSELYMNFAVLPDNSKLKIFGLAVLELMHKLLKTDRSPDIVRCICQRLKLIGWEVENAKDANMQKQFDFVLNELKLIRTSAANEGQGGSVALIDMIVRLHSNEWDRKPEPSPPAASPSTTSYVQSPSQPIYYEMPDSDDDFSDDDGAIMLDDEPEEVQAAYEEFLKMTAQSRK